MMRKVTQHYMFPMVARCYGEPLASCGTLNTPLAILRFSYRVQFLMPLADHNDKLNSLPLLCFLSQLPFVLDSDNGIRLGG